MWDIDSVPCDTSDPAEMPLEHLEARICELAGHIEAATARYLRLVADFDARQGWASWEVSSCAAWLSWKCQIAPNTAREHVRVANKLKELPVIQEEFDSARLSYSKVRALTRIATPDSDKDLAEMAMPMTACQLEGFTRAWRQVDRGEQGGKPACKEPTVRIRNDETGISLGIHLPPAEGAVILQALRAAVNDLDHPHDSHDGGTGKDDGTETEKDGHEDGDETREDKLRNADQRDGIDWDADIKPTPFRVYAADLARALVEICGQYLAGLASDADNADIYQVIVHAGTGAVTDAPRPGAGGSTADEAGAPAGAPDASASDAPAGARRPGKNDPAGQALAILKETIPLLRFPESHPAWAWRSHVEGGGYVDPAILQMIACNATISTMLHDQDGTVLNVGRRTRKPSPALRRAVRERDRYRCRAPGCRSRRVDLHHVTFWANGGETAYENLICLCKRHHRIVHERGILLTRNDSGFEFRLPDGTLIPDAPPLPGGSADEIAACHDADITYSTIVPPHSGERLNLHEAIWICFHNARVQAERREREQAEREPAENGLNSVDTP